MCGSRLSCSAALALLLTACGGGGDDATPATDSAVAAALAPGTMPAGTLQAIPLTESDVEHFIAAAKELHALGVTAQDDLGSDPSKTQSYVAALQTSAEAMAILRKHTFDAPRYQQVATSVMMAYAAEDVKKSNVDMKANLEQMKASLPKEQYEQMKKMTEAADANMQAFANQPQSNIDLVARYRDQIDALSKLPR